MKRILQSMVIVAATSWAGMSRAAASADAAQLASHASDAAHRAHPILMGVLHLVFIIVMVSFGATILTAIMHPQRRR